MSQKYPGGFITKTPTAPTASAAPGIWTLDQAMQNQKAGNWPFGGPFTYIEDVFSTYLFAGNDSTQTITNGIDLSANGGLVWTKNRTNAYNHTLYDTVRGTNNALISNSTAAAASASNTLTAFNVNGFTLGAGGNDNVSGTNTASWTFRKQPKFFDIVTYTGNGSSLRSLSHSLGSEPGFIVVKKTSGAENWGVYHRSLPAAGRIVYLNLTFTDSDGYVGFTPPTSSIFYVGGGGSGISGGTATSNENGATYVAYLFAHNAGGFGALGTDNVITCGSYTGIAYPTSLDVNVGFEPQWVLIKNATTASGWAMWDVMRGMAVVPAANTAQAQLLEPNTTAAESIQPGIYPTATGFVVKNGLTSISGSGDTMIYIAIRRGPMKVPTLGTTVFASTGHNGTGATNNSITFDPVPYIDLTWIKSRNTAGTLWAWTDRLRGATKELNSSTTTAETTYANDVTGLDYMSASGQSIRLGSGASGNVNTSSYTYSDIGFRRAPGFFDEVCYTGTGSATTVTHNLGVAPEMMIVKSRSNGALGWYVYSTGLGPTKCNVLNQTDGQFTSSTFWNDTAPTSSVFTLGSGGTNGSGNTQVAYLFATCPGVSKVGSYTGNGASQTINCGFTTGSRFVLIKRTDSTSDWYVWDSARGIVAGNDPYLLLNSTAAEVTGTDAVDTDSTGFIVNRLVAVDVNENAGTYIFLAIA